MTRSTDFAATVKRGARAVEPDLVIYARPGNIELAEAPKVGLIIARSVGSAVQRHQLARRLRHVARRMVGELQRSEHVVIRALPSSRNVGSVRLEEELRAGLRRIEAAGSRR